MPIWNAKHSQTWACDGGHAHCSPSRLTDAAQDPGAGSCCFAVKPSSDGCHVSVRPQVQVFGAALAARTGQPRRRAAAAPAANQQTGSFNHYDNGRGLWVSIRPRNPCSCSTRVGNVQGLDQKMWSQCRATQSSQAGIGHCTWLLQAPVQWERPLGKRSSW